MNAKKSSIKDDGYQLISISNEILQKIQLSILLNINEKDKLPKLLNIAGVASALKNLSDDEFNSLFGSIAYRYLDEDIADYLYSYFKVQILQNMNIEITEIPSIRDDDKLLNEKLKYPQKAIWYRLVRYDCGDVGSAHRDSDFWKVDSLPSISAQEFRRWKIWIPIYGCNELNSLFVVPRSHNDPNVPVTYVNKFGKLKPVIPNEYLDRLSAVSLCPFSFKKNEAIIFDDNLIHWGPKNLSSNLRISIECTLIESINCHI